jgi:hypothetical protein
MKVAIINFGGYNEYALPQESFHLISRFIPVAKDKDGNWIRTDKPVKIITNQTLNDEEPSNA